MVRKNLREFFKRLDFFGWPIIVSILIYLIVLALGSIFYLLLERFPFSGEGLIAWGIVGLAFVLLVLNFAVIDRAYLKFIWNKDILTVREFEKMEKELDSYAKKGKQFTPKNYYMGLQTFFGFFEFAIFTWYLSFHLSRFFWFFKTLKYARKEFLFLRKYEKKKSEIVYGFRSLFDEKSKDYFYQPFVIPIIKRSKR